MTVSKIIEEVVNDMCDKYCKYPALYQRIYGSCQDEAEERMMEKECENCPLNKLL